MSECKPYKELPDANCYGSYSLKIGKCNYKSPNSKFTAVCNGDKCKYDRDNVSIDLTCNGSNFEYKNNNIEFKGSCTCNDVVEFASDKLTEENTRDNSSQAKLSAIKTFSLIVILGCVISSM